MAPGTQFVIGKQTLGVKKEIHEIFETELENTGDETR